MISRKIFGALFSVLLFLLTVSGCKPQTNTQGAEAGKPGAAEKSAEAEELIPVETGAVNLLYAPVTYLPEEEEKVEEKRSSKA
ncbi:MAG TPA: hypothetical protein PKL97_08385 [Candidatus Omnitrophota bacterium]|nr:hypothetical protein [Candidatus Omnitrophota bacterium]